MGVVIGGGFVFWMGYLFGIADRGRNMISFGCCVLLCCQMLGYSCQYLTINEDYLVCGSLELWVWV